MATMEVTLSVKIGKVTLRPRVVCNSVIGAENALRALQDHPDVLEVAIDKEDISAEVEPVIEPKASYTPREREK